jgi:hypothetical protein
VSRELPGPGSLNGDWDLLSHRYDIGRERADYWLAVNFDHLGFESTVDFQGEYF